MKRLAVALAAVALANCRYGGQLVADDHQLDDGCRSHCASVHASCVGHGEAAKWGLPGVTYDLCNRELEDCRAGCHDFATQLPAVSDAGAALRHPGVGWEGGTTALRCGWSATTLAIPPEFASSIHRVGPSEVQVRSLPDAVLSMQAAAGEAPPMLEDWGRLHAELTGDVLSKVSMQARGTNTGWSVDYTVGEPPEEVRFRAAQRTVRRSGGFCRVIAIERTDVGPGRSLFPLVQRFAPPSVLGP